MLHFDEIVFGPIYSRRLGSSLGVNVLPTKGKVCNFDCIYCECGWNRDGISDRKFPDEEQVRIALQEKLANLSGQGLTVDSITFSGNGEPTLNPRFPQIVDVTLALRDRYCPTAKVSVLSNASTLANPAVAEALMKTDNPILKLDAADDAIVHDMNRPSGRYEVSSVVEAMKRFEGRFILQTMFLKSDMFDQGKGTMLERWLDVVRMLRPMKVMVYTIDRETPDRTLRKYTVEEMACFVEPLVVEGFDVQISG